MMLLQSVSIMFMQRTFVEIYKSKTPASRVQKILAGARHVVALTQDQKVC